MRDTKMTAGKNYDDITCPFCFKTFDSETVHFKAMTLKEAGTELIALDDFSETADEDFDFFAEAGDTEQDKTEDKSLNQLFQEKEDVLYKNFWKRYANQPEWKYANYPVITDKDSRMMMSGYHHDADGFVDSVTDAFGESTRERICPHCHNPLPPNYGKYPVHFIATVGITSSGKTVYLSQLMKNMDGIMANVGLGTLSMTEGDARFIKEHPVKKDIPLPQGTTPGAFILCHSQQGDVPHPGILRRGRGELCRPGRHGKVWSICGTCGRNYHDSGPGPVSQGAGRYGG